MSIRWNRKHQGHPWCRGGVELLSFWFIQPALVLFIITARYEAADLGRDWSPLDLMTPPCRSCCTLSAMCSTSVIVVRWVKARNQPVREVGREALGLSPWPAGPFPQCTCRSSRSRELPEEYLEGLFRLRRIYASTARVEINELTLWTRTINCLLCINVFISTHRNGKYVP